MSRLNFDAGQFSPAVALEPVPAGWYVCYMAASEMKPNSANTGAYLEMEFVILSPAQFAGRKLFDRLNLQNPNPTAVEIACRTLSAICHAVGVIQVEDSSILHNRPLQVKVNLKPASVGADGKSYEANNEVKGYKAIEHAAPAPQPQFAAPPPFVPPAAPQFAPPAPPAAPQPQPPQFAAPPAPQQWTPPAAPPAAPQPPQFGQPAAAAAPTFAPPAAPQPPQFATPPAPPAAPTAPPAAPTAPQPPQWTPPAAPAAPAPDHANTPPWLR